jgi:alpha 1,2-mannosyltransferase
MKFLREVTDLPIELFHAGATEMPEAVRESLVEDFAPISVRDITEPGLSALYPFLPVSDFSGCHIKPHALLHSTFEEIFFIDADNIPLQSPEKLFASSEYRQSGAIFWPDLARTKGTSEVLFRIFGIMSELLKSDFEFESGQIVIDKRRCWKALLTTCLANSDLQDFRRFCHRHAIGDKDTFRLAFQFAGTPYHLVSHPSRGLGNKYVIIPIPLTGFEIKVQHDLGSYYATGMLQRDLSGAPLFIHKTVCEWDCFLDFQTLRCVEDEEGNSSVLPFLAELERRGYTYLKEFKKRYLPAFGRKPFKVFRSLIARVAVTTLDGIKFLRPLKSGQTVNGIDPAIDAEKKARNVT